MEFKDKLKMLRTGGGLSQQALADAIHVSRSAVAKWENGLGYPSRDCFEALMAYFEVDETFFRTEEPETVIVSKNRHIQILAVTLTVMIAAAVLSSVCLFLIWIGTVSENNMEGLARQAEAYLGYEELEIVKTAKRGDYLAALCQDPAGAWCMCVFERHDLFADRWVAGGGKKSLDPGKIGSWNYGSPAQEAVLIFCGGDLPENVKWYSFSNEDIEYTCPVNGEVVLDVFIILDQSSISGHPIALDAEQKPIS